MIPPFSRSSRSVTSTSDRSGRPPPWLRSTKPTLSTWCHGRHSSALFTIAQLFWNQSGFLLILGILSVLCRSLAYIFLKKISSFACTSCRDLIKEELLRDRKRKRPTPGGIQTLHLGSYCSWGMRSTAVLQLPAARFGCNVKTLCIYASRFTNCLLDFFVKSSLICNSFESSGILYFPWEILGDFSERLAEFNAFGFISGAFLVTSPWMRCTARCLASTTSTASTSRWSSSTPSTIRSFLRSCLKKSRQSQVSSNCLLSTSKLR